MAAVDARGATGAYKYVFVVISHADHLMRHHLADRQNEVVVVVDEAIHLGRPRVVETAFADVVDEIGGDFTKGDDVVAPVVNTEEVARSFAKHGRDLGIGHGAMGAERGEHVGEGFAVVPMDHLGQDAGLRVEAREVGWDGEDFFTGAELFERGDEVLLDPGGREIGFSGTDGEEGAHRR